MNDQALIRQRKHLAELLEAVQRCAYFLHASSAKLAWPLNKAELHARNKDISLFETLAAINERFAKLQDTLGVAMRHSLLLSGEVGDTFLKTLAFFEKIGVLDSVESWQLCRATRNLAAHDYGTDYAEIAEHFNNLRVLTPNLYGNAGRFVEYCRTELNIQPASEDFAKEFATILQTPTGH